MALSKIPAGGISASLGISGADQWRLTSNLNSDQAPISTNLERNDSGGFSLLGTGMTESSGTFSFPDTGYWLVTFNCMLSQNSGAEGDGNAQIHLTTDNSTYNLFSGAKFSMDFNSNMTRFNVTTHGIIDVTDTSTHKVQFHVSAITSNTSIAGNTGRNDTFFSFIRLGDT